MRLDLSFAGTLAILFSASVLLNLAAVNRSHGDVVEEDQASPRNDLPADNSQGRFDLDALIKVALANNPAVAENTYAVHQAEAQRDMVKAQRWPIVHGVGAYAFHDDPQLLVPLSSFGGQAVFSDQIASTDLVASIPLFTGGRIENEILGAQLGRDAAEQGLERTRKKLIFDVSRFYYAILGQKKVVESITFSRDALREHRRRVEGLISTERAARVDLLRTEVRLADVEQVLAQEKSLLTIQHRALVNLLGLEQPPENFILTGSLEFKEVDTNLSESIAKAFRLRDDYAAAKSKLEAKERMVNAASASRWPTLFVRASYGRRWAENPTVLSSGVRDREDVGQISLNLDIPLFKGGAIAARVRREKAALNGEREALRRFELAIRLEVETAVLYVDTNRKRITATSKAVEQAAESLEIEREKYELGRGTITDVLDSQTELLNAQTQRARSLVAYTTAVAEWLLASGEIP